MKTEIAWKVDKRVLRCFVHLERKDGNCLIKRVMNTSVDGRAPRGRSRFCWMEGVKSPFSKRVSNVDIVRVHVKNCNKCKGI